MNTASSSAPRQGRARHQLAINAIAVGARLVAGVLVFVLIARALGPAAFGDFAVAFAVSGLLAFLGGLGFTQQALREIPAQSAEGRRIAGELATARLGLTGLVLLFALAAGWAHGGWWWLLAWLTLATALDAATEFVFALTKAKGHYAEEATVMSLASVLNLAVVGWVAWSTSDAMAIAYAYVATRAAQFVGAWVAVRKVIDTPNRPRSLGAVIAQVRSGWAYALDGGLAVVQQHLDVVAVRILMGPATAGLYQAAMRLVVGFQSASVVVGNVFIPRLARAAADSAAWQQASRQLQKVYLLLATAGGCAVALLGHLLTRYGYGAEYESLQPLWPWLGGLFALRMLAASYGVRLTAMGLQQFRSLVTATALVIWIALVMLAASVGGGLAGVIGALLGSGLVILIAYRWRSQRPWSRT